MILMEPVSIRIKEVKVTAITPSQLLRNFRTNLSANYTSGTVLMDAFYRETIKQDGNFINVSEAVIETLKAPYQSYMTDASKLIKGRQSNNVNPFRWMNLKLQGGPYTISQLDVVKTMDSFLDEKYQHLYNYNISDAICYNGLPVLVLEFEPVRANNFHGYTGEVYVHRETFAVVHARFGLNRKGLKKATPMLVRHTPRNVKATPFFVEYQVNYQAFRGKWHLASARADVKFRVRSRREKLNSEFHSVSDLLITDIHPTTLKRFPRSESFSYRDVFVEMIGHYDPAFWENYNIIEPDEDLRNAVQKLTTKDR